MEKKEKIEKLIEEAEYVTFIVFGASGDLSKRKIFPGLFSLFVENLMPKKWKIIGYARSKIQDKLRELFEPFFGSKEELEKIETKKNLDAFFKNVSYMDGAYDNEENFKSLLFSIESLEKDSQSSQTNRLFYLSLPPSVFLPCVSTIGKILKTKTTGWNRCVIEKPFGKDLESFEELRINIKKYFETGELYLIDHFIGKECVQNLIALRFGNVIFEPLWNRNNVKCIQIIMTETLGVEGRGGYFDNYGIVRDILQNHAMQILTLITMDQPISLNHHDIVSEKVKILKCISPITKEDIIIGQYTACKSDAKKIGYKEDPTVDVNSITPTFCACALKIKNRRWDNVPILMKCGKALDEKVSQIRIQFHDVPANLYKKSKIQANELVIRIQPDEAIYFNIMNKEAGYNENLVLSQLDFTYKTKTKKIIPDAYARLIRDVFRGKKSNFVDEEELELSWKIWSPILTKIEKEKIVPEPYAFGSNGPVDQHYLSSKYGVKWCN